MAVLDPPRTQTDAAATKQDQGRTPPRVFQCPGCWSFGLYRSEPGSLECSCGERMTLIDLRARTIDGPHGSFWWEDES